MKVGRRSFLAAAGVLSGASLVQGTSANVLTPARSVRDFGVDPGSNADQTAALQKAIDTISAAGDAVQLPGGTYRVTSLRLPTSCAIIGVTGATKLQSDESNAIFQAESAQSVTLAGLACEGALLSGSAAEAAVEMVRVENAPANAISLTGLKNLFISRSVFEGCKGAAINIKTDPAKSAATLANNHITNCKSGIMLRGNGQIIGNTITGCADFGLRLGGGSSAASISATNNLIQDCGVGIGIAANEEMLFVALNQITGMSQSNASAIRALNGDELIGPDLAFESAEAYLNVTIMGNVAR